MSQNRSSITEFGYLIEVQLDFNVFERRIDHSHTGIKIRVCNDHFLRLTLAKIY